mgnify:CR=1 FL=1
MASPRHGELATATPVLSDTDFEALAGILHSRTGIKLSASKRPLVISRLSKRLRALDLCDFSQYRRLVETETDGAEFSHMISSLTTNVTKFFRENQHFESFSSLVTDELRPSAQRGEKIRIWSAGCSTGEEPYSLATTVLSTFPDAANYDFKILATDIDSNVVAKAQAGRYPEQAVKQASSEKLKDYFELAADGEMVASSGLQRLITFRILNLLDPWPMKGPFDAIMCRNVVIYFDEATQERLFCRFAGMLKPGGRFYIGHSERLTQEAQHYFEADGVTSFCRNTTRIDAR